MSAKQISFFICLTLLLNLIEYPTQEIDRSLVSKTREHLGTAGSVECCFGMQVEHLAEEAGPLVEALPRALKRAVANDKVPNDLVQDILWLAARIEPHVEQWKAQIEKLPEQVEQALDQADDYVDQAAEVGFLNR